jgi:DNA sulfur modification protein DndE
MNYNGEPIEWAMNYGEVKALSADTPTFRNIHIQNVKCESAKKAIELYGLPHHPIDGIVLDNVSITADREGTIDFVEGLRINNFSITITPN